MPCRHRSGQAGCCHLAKRLIESARSRAPGAWDDMPVPDMLERARAAIRSGDAATARRALEAVDPVDAAAREAFAQVCYLELDFRGAIEGRIHTVVATPLMKRCRDVEGAPACAGRDATSVLA